MHRIEFPLYSKIKICKSALHISIKVDCERLISEAGHSSNPRKRTREQQQLSPLNGWFLVSIDFNYSFAAKKLFLGNIWRECSDMNGWKMRIVRTCHFCPTRKRKLFPEQTEALLGEKQMGMMMVTTIPVMMVENMLCKLCRKIKYSFLVIYWH